MHFCFISSGVFWDTMADEVNTHTKILVFGSVSEPVHCYAVPAPACQKFRLRLQLRLLIRPFSSHILEKIQTFSWFQPNFMLFKTINDHQKGSCKVNSYENFFFELNIPRARPKILGSSSSKKYRSTGSRSGSAILVFGLLNHFSKASL
jgi:hypothetical protein